MKFFAKLAFFAFVILTQASCTSILFVDTSLPPAVKVAPEQWKVVAINRFNPELLPYNREKKLDVFRKASNEALFGAVEAVAKDNTFSLIAEDSTGQYKAQTANQPLSKAQAEAIYAQHPHHLILTLENFDAFFDQTTEREKESNGNVSKTAHYTLNTRTTWALYDSTGTLIDRATISASEYYKSRGVLSGLLAVGPSISNAGSMLNMLAWQTGLQYWERLHPKPISFTRTYYSNKEFKPAASHIAASQWQQATALLTPLTENADRKVAGKAAYNLAIVHEAQGNMDEAKRWAKVAAEKGNRMAKELLYFVNYNGASFSQFIKLSSGN